MFSGRDLILLVGHAESDRVGDAGAIVEQVDDRDAMRIDPQVPDQQRQRALGHRTAAQYSTRSGRMVIRRTPGSSLTSS